MPDVDYSRIRCHLTHVFFFFHAFPIEVKYLPFAVVRLFPSPLCVCLFFFFFQAEDGIRDLTVTGVQTCALPISLHLSSCLGWVLPLTGARHAPGPHTSRLTSRLSSRQGSPRVVARRRHSIRPAGDRKSVGEGKGVDLGGRRIIKKKKSKCRVEPD